MSNIQNFQPKQVSLAPRNMSEAMQFADMLAQSDMVPKDFKGKPANCLVAMQWGLEVGLAPLQALQNIAVINGRPSIWGDAALALVRGSGLLKMIDECVIDGTAICKIQRKGEQQTERTFSVEDAQKARLWGKQGPWTQYPQRMLQMRARSWALRDVFPDVLKGVGIAEEVQDIPADKPVRAQLNETKPEPVKVTATLVTEPKERPQAFGVVKVNQEQTDVMKGLVPKLGIKPDDVSAEVKQRYGCSWKELSHDNAEDYIEHLLARIAEVDTQERFEEVNANAVVAQ